MSVITTIKQIQETWAVLFPGAPVPNQKQCALWLTLHPEKTVREAIGKLAIKQQNGTAPTTNLDRFASSIMQRIDAQREQKITPNTATTNTVTVPTESNDDVDSDARWNR
jgi:hypothetical protein